MTNERNIEKLKESYMRHLKYTLAKDQYTNTPRDCLTSLALAVRDRLVGRWINTQQFYYDRDVKRVYYLSLEFLMGRAMVNSLINLNMYDDAIKALSELDQDLRELEEIEFDAGLGNGGLGRLAACFLDSLATLGYPAYGYGIRYDYGIFFQKILNGYQVESPDPWLRYGNPWEIERPEYLYPVKFYGRVYQYVDDQQILRNDWIDTRDVMAVPYDIPVPGYGNQTVNTLRLWSAKSTREFELEYFNDGDYERAVSDKAKSETISKVLYPNDNVFEGKELRLKQEYFFVSATIQDIIRRYKKNRPDKHEFRTFPDKVAIQLNDTHPAIAIPELMRVLVDEEEIGWDAAWDITRKTFGYTNHTVLPEALEKWPLTLFEQVLPRHLQIIYEINMRFLEQVNVMFPDDTDRLRTTSIIEEGREKKIRMANLAIIGSHSVNGVSELHTEIIKSEIFRYFYEIFPEKFNNKTNGITQRRWLKLSNPCLSEVISKQIGEEWITDLAILKDLEPLAENADFREHWNDAKRRNKKTLAKLIMKSNGVKLDLDSIFDCHVKRIHEYKRQLLNALHIVHLYAQIKDDPQGIHVPRTFIFAGKAAPGYLMAKRIIKLINSIADVVNNDKDIRDLIKVVFLENYSVSLAEKIFPAADVSEQISTAGMEASGTGNMKFALNGALTVGTLDGANIEIRNEVGDDNIFIFGYTADEIAMLKKNVYDPLQKYFDMPYIKRVIDMIAGGHFSPSEPDLFKPVTDSLLYGGDRYMVLADFESYMECHKDVAEAYTDRHHWAAMSIRNVANMGYFSTDRTINEYASEIWKTDPVTIDKIYHHE